MKKLLSFLLLFGLAVAAMAKDAHIKFMGIPLDGSINAYEQKLAAKGMQNDREYNATTPVGSRRFSGQFCGYDAHVIIYYDAASKIVYRAKAYISSEDHNFIAGIYREFAEALDKKYADWDGTPDTYNHYDSYSWTSSLGEIDIYRSDFEVDGYPTMFSVHLDYWDEINNQQHELSSSSDL